MDKDKGNNLEGEPRPAEGRKQSAQSISHLITITAFVAALVAIGAAVHCHGRFSADIARFKEALDKNATVLSEHTKILQNQERSLSGLKQDLTTIMQAKDSLQAFTEEMRSSMNGVAEEIASNDAFRRLLQETILRDLETVPVGTVIAFHGEYGELQRCLESGWAICDGTNGTPNLVHRFVRGTSVAAYYDPQHSREGGQETHSHKTRTSPPLGDSYRFSHLGAGRKAAPHDHIHEFAVLPGTNIPPFYQLIYLVRVATK